MCWRLATIGKDGGGGALRAMTNEARALLSSPDNCRFPIRSRVDGAAPTCSENVRPPFVRPSTVLVRFHPSGPF